MTSDSSTAYALIDADRHAFCVTENGKRYTLSTPSALQWVDWSKQRPTEIAHSWPTWNHRGDTIALFQLTKSMERCQTQIMTTDPKGIYTEDLLSFDSRLPIYLSWNPSDNVLAALTQRQDFLSLSVSDPDSLGVEHRITSGSPLFFTWAGTRRLAVFVGHSEQQSKMVIYTPDKHREITPLPGVPNHFCTPLWTQKHLYYVVEKGNGGVLIRVNPETLDTQPILDTDGLVALVTSPNGQYIAYSTSHRGSNGPYQGLNILHVASGKKQQIDTKTCLAFVWSPSNEALIVVRYHHEKHTVRLEHLSLDGTIIPLTDLQPTRDTSFYLRFFEQFAVSHPLISADGTTMLVAGGRPTRKDLPSSTIWSVPLNGDEPTAIDNGVFAIPKPVSTGP